MALVSLEQIEIGLFSVSRGLGRTGLCSWHTEVARGGEGAQ